MASDKLPAVLGGPPAVTFDSGAATRWPMLDENDERAVLEILRDGDISTHPVIRELEKDWMQATGSRHALAHNNGTSALLAAFFALDLEPGDEILVPSATFWASALPMLWLGLVPVFCESELDSLGICPEDVEKKITDRTRAIVIVHLWGMPSKMAELRDIADRHDLKIIEDASHAHGAVWHGEPCGTLGDIGVFSLQGDKLAPAGEGGVLLTDSDAYFERAICLGDITRIIELESPARRFAATSFGIKTRMAPLSAAIARSQLKRLAEHNRARAESIGYLSQRLQDLGIECYLPPLGIERVYFEFVVRVDPERIALPIDLLVAALQSEGCDVFAPRYPLLHQQPFFTEGTFLDVARLPDAIEVPVYEPQALPKTEAAQGQFIRLPAFRGAEVELLDQYVEAFEKVLAHSGAISVL